jgi:hydrogenase nickel incorporation protein HypA/HybF
MHEVSFAGEIINIVSESIPKETKVSVKCIKISLGEYSNIVPESLKFCFDILKNETCLNHAVLDIEIIPLIVQCFICDRISTLDDPLLFCPKCQSRYVKIISGTEAVIKEIILD